jgi:uncharacterized protein YdaU (DUF1376 family)
MSNKDPAFLFYSGDFLVGVSDLTMEERGQYITLIALQHQKGHLSKRNIDLAVPNVSDFVLAKFKIDENGCYYNERTEEEIQKRNKYIEAQRSNGAKGGRPPKNPKETHGLENENPRANPSENENENKIINTNIIDIIQDSKDNIDCIYNKQFEEFWEKYPRKVAKKYAYECYLRLKMTENLHQTMLSALDKQKRSKAWEDEKYIPHPSTWINQHRWDDEISEEPLSSFDADDFFNYAVQKSKEKMRGNKK